MWVTEREPEWDDDERDIMVALHIIQQDRCPRGHPLEMMTDQSPADQLEAGSPIDTTVTDVWCMACRAQDLHQAELVEWDKKLHDTPLDEAPGRYSIAHRADPPNAS